MGFSGDRQDVLVFLSLEEFSSFLWSTQRIQHSQWSRNRYFSVIPCAFNDSVQLNLVTQSCSTLCDPMNCSRLGLPVHHQLPESIQTHVHWVGDAIQSSSVIRFSSYPKSLPASGSFQMSQLFTSGSQSIEVSASTSALPMNTQG